MVRLIYFDTKRVITLRRLWPICDWRLRRGIRTRWYHPCTALKTNILVECRVLTEQTSDSAVRRSFTHNIHYLLWSITLLVMIIAFTNQICVSYCTFMYFNKFCNTNGEIRTWSNDSISIIAFSHLYLWRSRSSSLSRRSVGIILCMHTANERRYTVTSFFYCRAHTQKGPWISNFIHSRPSSCHCTVSLAFDITSNETENDGWKLS